ncbi:hypothetical protein GUITHDRAFT_142681 [Guillardia theta CCMP2712]|uniref:Uncharacterized protein n=1 Tax=Guillardia theta (strain CCMP2712) TaxID=905079 RepID=L1IXK9_GUITC|nr:hypothetical protein GUITHDRAFT_142681 [Guillardia theta CCMP2712]EKX40585.1 hypothetical protein GUITHDRAFT_142681 [Guillardia theta CCMP2712]|eukprot:XP_005827565.1 hypothetical protein GUITHDRAFT_142681 [Guillardia theta CCMP2712]
MNKLKTISCMMGKTTPRLSRSYSFHVLHPQMRRIRPVAPRLHMPWLRQGRHFSEGPESGPERKEGAANAQSKVDCTWGFKSRDAILEVLDDNRQISQQMVRTCLLGGCRRSHTFMLLAFQFHDALEEVEHEGIEMGTIHAFLCIAEMYRSRDESKFEIHSSSILNGGLAMQFAKQAQIVSPLSLLANRAPQLKSSLLYSIVTFEEVVPDFEGHWSVRFFGKNMLSSFITVRAFSSDTLFLTLVHLQVTMHIKGRQRISFVNLEQWEHRPPMIDETSSDDTGFEDFDHVWLLEAMIDWKDFIQMNQMPTGFESGEDHENIQYRWIVKDINEHMETIGEQSKWNIRWS